MLWPRRVNDTNGLLSDVYIITSSGYFCVNIVSIVVKYNGMSSGLTFQQRGLIMPFNEEEYKEKLRVFEIIGNYGRAKKLLKNYIKIR